MAAGVEETGHVDEGVDLAEGAAADHPGDEVLGELPQDGPDLVLYEKNKTMFSLQ